MKEIVLSAMLSAVDADSAQGYSLISWHLPADVACPGMKMLKTLCSQKVCKTPSNGMHLQQKERTQERV
jgi:putative NIF3 family GTP cyclohydrolase 1 type 2